MELIVEEKKSSRPDIIPKSIAKICRTIYPPLPENMTERKKILIVDFFIRLIVNLPMKILGMIGGSKYELKWLRLIFNGLFSMVNDKGLGEDETMKVTSPSFPDNDVRVYEPKQRKGDGAIIFFHGGGFVLYPVGTYDCLTRRICERSGLTLISVAYRLAPEYKYPAAVEDCERATVHFLTEGYKHYAVDPHRTVIMGDSAGGNLAAVVTQRLRKKDMPQPKLQVLVYPCTQILDFKLPSMKLEQRCEGTGLLSPSLKARFALHYLVGEDIGHYIQDLLENRHVTPELRRSPLFDHVRWQHLPEAYRPDPSAYGQEDSCEQDTVNMDLYNCLQPYLKDPDVNPLLNPNLEGSPDSMVITVGNDPLMDDGILFAERLRKAGVEVTHKHYPTGFHGVFTIPQLELCKEAIEEMVTFIHNNL